MQGISNVMFLLALLGAAEAKRGRDQETLDLNVIEKKGKFDVTNEGAKKDTLDFTAQETTVGDGDDIPFEETNLAHIGSEQDKAARKASALGEKAWTNVGKAPGIQIWRIEKFKVVAWPEEQYGEFYTGDSYIVLKTSAPKRVVTDDAELSHDIFFWLGNFSSVDEKGTAAYKTVELDTVFDGKATQHRECQGSESEEFQKLFEKKITYLEGGIDSGFKARGATQYRASLFMVRKLQSNKEVKVKEVPLEKKSMNNGDSFVLDMGTLIYVWNGPDASNFEQHKANEKAKEIENLRPGKAKTTHDLEDKLPDGRSFWDCLPGSEEIANAVDVTDEKFKNMEANLGDGILYKLSDETGTLQSTEVGRGKLDRSMLVSDDVMMVDHGSEVFVWIGKGASELERNNAKATGMNYVRINNKLDGHKLPEIHVYFEKVAIQNQIWTNIFSESEPK